jgi:Holliday junction resolvasome RuvABC endonuclease subunit
MLRVADCAGIVAGIATMVWPDAALWRPTPGEWKKGAGMKGNARKDDVRAFCAGIYHGADDQRQDALDALAMAYAAYRTAADAVDDGGGI